MNPTLPTVIPFGKHRNEPLTAVPTSYLRWFVETVANRPRLVEAARAELVRRGVLQAPAPQPPAPAAPPERCSRCQGTDTIVYWRVIRTGEKRIGCDCRACGASIRLLPHTEENMRKAAEGTEPGGLLRLLIELEDRNIRVRRNGDSLEYAPIPLPPSLRRLERQCMGLLVSMLSSHPEGWYNL